MFSLYAIQDVLSESLKAKKHQYKLLKARIDRLALMDKEIQKVQNRKNLMVCVMELSCAQYDDALT